MKKPKFNSIFEKREYNLMLWATYWKHNPHRWVEDYLGMRLFFYQKILLYLMNIAPTFVFIASRGLGKSYLVALFAIFRCVMYPGSRVVIVAGTKDQARLIISSKIKDIYNKSEALRSEIGDLKNINTSVNNAGVLFKNGSEIVTAASNDGARGHRANLIISDEFRLIDPDIYKEVIYPMANVPRTPRFKELNPVEYEWYSEPNMQVLMSSAYYKSNWAWEEFQTTIGGMLDNFENSVAVALPYQLARIHGILQQSTIDKILEDESYDGYSFNMEYEALFVGESENAYFKYDMLSSARVLEKSFIPPTTLEYLENQRLSKPKNISNMPLQKGEIRIVSLDVALMGGKNNDTSVFVCLRMIPDKNGGFKRDIVYIDSINEAISEKDLAIRFKRLYYDFEASYAVLDTMGNGSGVYDRCAEILYDEERDIEYEAWESINDEKMRQRYRNHNALPVLYTVRADAKFNHEIALNLRSSLLNNKVRLLISDIKKREKKVGESGAEYLTSSAEEQQRYLAPYQQTTALVNEMIALNYTIGNGGYIKIYESGGATKDRYVSLAYANIKANDLELEHKKRNSGGAFDAKLFSFNWKR